MLFDSFAGNRIISWFLQNPARKIHFKELCRQLGLSPSTVKAYCGEFSKKGWVLSERQANLRIYSLNNESFSVRALKRAHFILVLDRLKAGKVALEGAISLALYGSYASGEYDEKSDVDLLLLGRKEQVDYGFAKRVEEALGKEVQITVFSLHEWEKGRDASPFMLSVLRNHALLKGIPL